MAKNMLTGDQRKAVLFRICDLFFRERRKPAQIARQITAEFGEFGRKFTRESIYPMLASARDKGLVKLAWPLEERLPQDLASAFKLDPKTIKVVDLDGQMGIEYVAEQAAQVVADLVKELLQSGREPVGIGLGPGRATLGVCKSLGELMRSETELPDKCLTLHAITAGGPSDHPEYAPISFFNLFPGRLVKGCTALFAETLVSKREFGELIGRGGIADAFATRKDVDIVITSRGAMAEEHNLFRMALEKEKADINHLRERGWIGDVQYRPYSAEGPIVEKDDDLRAVTMFDLEDFVDMAGRKGKHVVLIARSCSLCFAPQAIALRPLLEVPDLKVWSRIVMDVAVAKELLLGRHRCGRASPDGGRT